MSSAELFYDELGPRARRSVRLATVLSLIALGVIGWLIYLRLQSAGQLAGDKWAFLLDPQVRSFLLVGLLDTLQVAAVSMVLALLVGGLLAFGRLSALRPVRFVAGFLVEGFRAVPLLLLIFFIARQLPLWGLSFPAFWYLVIALVAYNGAVLAETFRAGILSLSRGQTEAALALGLNWRQRMRHILVPQAVRRVLPVVVSQLVTLLKDTSLGFVLPYEELLRRGQILGESFTQNTPFLQSIAVVAVLYLVVNLALSRFAQRLERGKRRGRVRTVVDTAT